MGSAISNKKAKPLYYKASKNSFISKKELENIKMIADNLSESCRENSTTYSTEAQQSSFIQQSRALFQKTGGINIQTPSRVIETNPNKGTPLRQSRFSKTQVFSSEENGEEQKIKLNNKRNQREKVVEQNTPLSTRLKGNRRGSLNLNNIFERLGSKQQSFNKILSYHDLEDDENDQKNKKSTLFDIAKQSSIHEIDEEIYQPKSSSKIISGSQISIKKKEEESSSENQSEMYDSSGMKLSQVKNGPPPSKLIRNSQRVKTLNHFNQRTSLLESLQEEKEAEEGKHMKSRNLIQVSPLQKQILQQKIMSISNFNMPQLSPDQSPIQFYDDLVDDQNDIQFSLQSMQLTQLEIAEIDQLNQIKENIQLKQRMSSIQQQETLNNIDRKNFHDDNPHNKSLDFFGERRDSSRRTTFRSLSQKRIVKESSVTHKSKYNGLKTMNQYEIGKVLGEGQYGKVRYAKVKDEGGKITEFAIKYFKKQNLKKMKQFYKDEKGRTKIFTGIQTVQSEIAVMKKLEHENIVKLYEVIEDNEHDKIYLVIDFAEKGQLIEYDERKQFFHLEKQHKEKGTIEGEIEYYEHSQTEYKNSDCSIMSNEEVQKEPVLQSVKEKVYFIDENLLRKIFRDCIKGLGYLHFNDVIHRDIKPQNILFTQNDAAVITDFSISLILGEQKVLKQDQGTLCFMAPELIENSKNVEKDNDFYKRADIWSLGVTFFSFIFYTLPYKSTNLDDLFDEISTTNLDFPQTRTISYGLKLILQSMLNNNPLERITLDELIDDQWINEGGFGNLRDEIELQEKIVISQTDIKQAMIPKNEIAFIQQNGSSMQLDSMNSSSMISYSVFESNRSIQYDGVIDNE